MKISLVSGLLVRSLLLVSFSGLLACSSVLQATRINRPAFPQSTKTGADVPPESVNETVLFTNDARQLDAEAAYGSQRSMVPGYQWKFLLKEGGHNGPDIGNWRTVSGFFLPR